MFFPARKYPFTVLRFVLNIDWFEQNKKPLKDTIAEEMLIHSFLIDIMIADLFYRIFTTYKKNDRISSVASSRRANSNTFSYYDKFKCLLRERLVYPVNVEYLMCHC